ncbi:MULTISPECIES: VWA domain-containing protein [unclassified Serratia (in: enterobacteria)]|uniref:vWA domain-containing protein n=1 Tax=unclassified Serratia (in: enterobacteria) TaxID=2647522 RepID=UPI0009E0AE37|nr:MULTISPECIES: VWA domain-containing protein [unclassified Serratia (in: enterobacteria)]
MKIKQAATLLALALFPLFGLAKTASPVVSVKSELAAPVMLVNSEDKNYLKVSLTGFNLDSQRRSPINLALVIDRSTSMSGDRIEKAREAAILAVNMLNPTDTLSVVAYDNSAEVIIPATKVSNKPALIASIQQHIRPQGMTALFAGVSKGIGQVGKHLNNEQVNRIILLSDGQANVGPTSISELAELARIAAKQGIAITTIGLGNDYNEDLMTAIAGYSDGNHAFVASSADLETAFTKEFQDVMSVVAQDVIVQIKTGDRVKPVRLLGRDGEISGNVVNVKLNQLYSNQEKYVLLEVIPAQGTDKQQKNLADVSVSYLNLSSKQQDQVNERVTVSYSQSAAKVRDAVQQEVVAESEIQKTALANDEAIRLIDAGRKDEAKKVLESNASKLSGMSFSSPVAESKVRESTEKQRKLAQDIDSKEAATYRKELKEQNYSVKQQQQ